MFLPLLLACEALLSPDVTNAELAVEAFVLSDGTQTEIGAKITRGRGIGLTPVHVGEEEAFVGYVGEEEAPLEAVELGFGDVTNTALFDAVSGGLNVGVRFDRTADDPIDDTFVVMPEDFSITAPTAGEGVAADIALVVLWSGAVSGGTVDVRFGGDCIPGYEVTGAEDVGGVEIPAESLAAAGEVCAASLTVVRTATGTVSDAWGAGGTIAAQNGRVVTVAVGN
ncbi:MAG: hypothetical protein Q8P18_29655 [Pseudomonadota bacterium]|nr:hypothetical protein [Pseudomonadota bacterium]